MPMESTKFPNPLPHLMTILFAMTLASGVANAQEQSGEILNAITNFSGSTGSAGCGGGTGNSLSVVLNNALPGANFNDNGAALAGRRSIYRFCDSITGSGSSGWTGDIDITDQQAVAQATVIAPEEVFSTMDDANASFNIQVSNVARRLSLVRLSRRSERNATEQLARSGRPVTSPRTTQDSLASNARGPVQVSEADRSERLLLALQEGINGGDEIGGKGLGFFLNGRINIISGKENEAERASDGFGGGFTLGADKQINDQFFAGLAFGYTNIVTNFRNSASDSKLDAVSFTAYGAYYPTDKIFVDGSISGSYLGFDISNEILISDGGPAPSSIDGKAHGGNFGFDVGVGYSLTLADAPFLGEQKFQALTALTLEPFARLSVLYTEIEDFNLSGGDGSIDLDIDKQQTTSVTGTFGVRTDYPVSTRLGVITPYLRVAYVHEFNKENDDIGASFAVIPGSDFTLKAQATDSNYANIGLGLSANLGQGFSEFIDYDVIAGHDNVTVHQVTAGLRLEY